MAPRTRRNVLAAAGAVAVAGCLSDDGGRDERGSPGGGATTSATPTAESVDTSPVPLAAETRPLPMAPTELRDEARSGGPPKDGIPSIDDPQFVQPAGGDEFLDDGDPVFGLARDGVAKAYPQKILVAHEICNDTVAGTPASVTYCPLTGTVLGFERGETTFGVSGQLVNNNLIMYDRATEAWWPQVLATSIPGPWNEEPGTRSLREFRLVWTTWELWRTEHPDTQVLSTETGYARNYSRDPYGSYNPAGGYYTNDSTLFPPLGDDDRYDPKTVVVGARTKEGAVAFPKAVLRNEHLLAGSLAGQPVLGVYDGRFDTAYVYRDPDERSFEPDGDDVVADDGTRYAPDSLPLERIHAFDAMWFAWSGFYPDTWVHE